MIDAHDDILLERQVPAGVPLLESWWWRALLAGSGVGLVPLLVVLWHFIDVSFGGWMERCWPGILTGFGILGAPELWLIGSLGACLWLAAQRERVQAQRAFDLFVTIASALLTCGVVDAFARGILILSGAADWSHLIPNARAATISAGVIWAWSILPAWRRRMLIVFVLVLAAEVALRVAYPSDALAGAWIGLLAGLVIPWIRWRGRDGWLPRRRWSIGDASATQPDGRADRAPS